MIGVRYCGGCNPHYDRVGALESLRRQFPDLVFESLHPERDYRLALVIHGCLRQCARLDHFDAPVVSITKPEDLRAAVSQLSHITTERK